jgi:hypothetical protein
LAAGLVAFPAVEDRRQEAEHGEAEPDEEPDEEGAPLDLADDRGGEAEEEEEDDELRAVHDVAAQARQVISATPIAPAMKSSLASEPVSEKAQ